MLIVGFAIYMHCEVVRVLVSAKALKLGLKANLILNSKINYSHGPVRVTPNLNLEFLPFLP